MRHVNSLLRFLMLIRLVNESDKQRFMKRFFPSITIVLLLVFSLPAYAEQIEKKTDYLSIKLTPEFGLLNGTIYEYVFDPRCNNTGNKLSELDWDLKNIPYFNFSADFDVLNYFYIGINGRIGLPADSGNMQDFDWLNSTPPSNHQEWINDSPTELTNYSIHNNKLIKYLSFYFNLGWNFHLPFEITLTPFLSYQYEIISFDGYDGYSIYKANNFVRNEFSGKVISYSQETNSIFLGLKFSVDSIPRTSIYGKIFFSPALAFINAIDCHHAKSAAYKDTLNFLWEIQAQLGAQYKFNKKHSAGISGGIQFIPLSKGPSYNKSLGSNGLPAYGRWATDSVTSGGAKRLVFSVSLNYSFSL